MSEFYRDLKLTDLYHQEGNRPAIPVGIEPAERQEAKSALLNYYGEQSTSFGLPISGDPFKDIRSHIESIPVDSSITGEELKRRLTAEELRAEDNDFLRVVASISMNG